MAKKIFSIIVTILCVLVCVATIANVLMDNAEVEGNAKNAVCANNEKCPYAIRAEARNPLWRSYTFEGAGKSIETKCMREFFIFGDYACKVPDSTATAP
ncbi:MAG: hypothetical protein FWD57_13490 [Polyangiaceae bacterium]|nr:hypothetical protein [Polyangiaceae bacterium]